MHGPLTFLFLWGSEQDGQNAVVNTIYLKMLNHEHIFPSEWKSAWKCISLYQKRPGFIPGFKKNKQTKKPTIIQLDDWPWPPPPPHPRIRNLYYLWTSAKMGFPFDPGEKNKHNQKEAAKHSIYRLFPSILLKLRSSCLILQVQLFSCDQCVPITQSDIGGVWHDRAAVEADRSYIYQHIHCLHCSACLSVMFFGQDPTLSLCTYKVV